MTTGLDIIGLESAASPIGHINLEVKLTRKRNAGDPHVAFDEGRELETWHGGDCEPNGQSKEAVWKPSA